jgi:hypothetical protein
MKLDEALGGAGVRDLRAFTEAWQIDVVKRDDPAEYVDRTLAQIKSFSEAERVEHHLALLADLPYRAQSLAKAALRQLINCPDYSAVVDEFHAVMIEQEQVFSEWAGKPTALRHLDPKVVEIYRVVLEAAWEDSVNSYEYRLLERLRAKLGITRRDHRVIELQIGKFPSITGGPHTASEIEDAMRNLTKRGLALRITVSGRHLYVIPSELADCLRTQLGIELTAPAFANLLQHLPVGALKDALEKAGQPFTGNREFLSARLVDGYVSPKAVLRGLTEEQLDEVLKRFPGVRQDGSHEIKVRNLVKYFDALSLSLPEPMMEDRGEAYVSYYKELASRDYGTLRAAGIASKDREVDRAFELATHTLFRDYLGMDPEAMEGSRHADGRVVLSASKRVLLWDCKSCESKYTLTDALARQFLSYCAEAAPAIASPMLIIAPSFSPDSAAVAQRLKVHCPPGTEVALIAAESLLWLARHWRQRRVKQALKTLPWEVLATTGELDQATLESRLKLFGG